MQAWSNIPKEMVRWSFKTCGNSNALDGTEDDAIYNCPQIDADDEEMEEEFDTDSKDDDERWWRWRLLWNTLNLTNGSFRSHHILKS